jgi:putative FmdB family regulatory protein
MPIYEYDCGDCERRFEILVRDDEDKSPACPDCGGRRCARAFSTFAMGGRSSASSSSSSSGGGGSSACAGCSRTSCAGCK